MAVVSRYTPEMIERYVREGHWTPDRTVDFWCRNARSRPHAVALADDQNSYTWSHGMRCIDAIAGALIAAGVPRDGVLLVQASNSALLVLFRLACEQAGIIPAFLHFGFRRSEIVSVAGKVKPIGAVIAVDGMDDLLPLYEELRNKLGLEHLFTVQQNLNGLPSLADLAAGSCGSGDFNARRVQPYELTGIVTSSGTTGMPKCVEYACWPRLASGRVYIERLKITSDDVILTCIPFYTGGGDLQFHTTPQVGAKLIVLPRFSPEVACSIIERERVTGTVLVPTMIARMAGLSDISRYKLSSLRWVMSGGGMLSYEIATRFEGLTGAKVTQGYGLMDCGAITSHSVDDPSEMRLRSTGRSLPGTELQVLDPYGLPLPPGSIGEICARGPHCNGAYIDDVEGVQRVWRDGFFHTGDLGRITDDGYAVLEGRSKDIIIRGGQNISAHEVESILYRHPAVADAALVRIADPELGERACAFVILRPGSSFTFEEMVAFVKSQKVAAYKIPERLEIVESFPMTAAGNKVDKKSLEAGLRNSASHLATRF